MIAPYVTGPAARLRHLGQGHLRGGPEEHRVPVGKELDRPLSGFAQHPAQCQQFLPVGQPARYRLAVDTIVDRPPRGGEPDRAGRQRLAQQLRHPGDLTRRRSTITRLITHDVIPQGGVSHHPRHVESGPGTLDRIEILGKRLERPVHPRPQRISRHALDVLQRQHDRLARIRTSRRHRIPTIPHNHRRDAMPTRRHQVTIPRDLRVVMRMTVNEPRSQHQPRQIDHRRARPIDIADLSDPPRLHPHITPPRNRTRAINQRRATQHHRLSHQNPLTSYGRLCSERLR